MDARRARWSGSSALVGGVLLTAKGASIVAYGFDPDFTAFAIAALAFAAWGVALALPPAQPSLRFARWLGAVVAAAAAFAVVGYVVFGAGPEGVPGAAGIALGATYALGTFGSLVVLLLTAPACAGERALGPARHAPLLAGGLTVPLMGIAWATLGSGWSLVLPGIVWLALGLTLVIEWGGAPKALA